MLLQRLFVPALAIFLLLVTTMAFGQTKVVSGTVMDQNGKVLQGVTVAAKNNTAATQTNESGYFSLTVPVNATALEFTSIGYATLEQPITSGEMNVILTSTAAALENVVVVAYGTRKKSDLTGSVTAVNSKDFQKGNIASSEQLIQGKVAGLEVTTGGGAAGGGSKIRIRGSASLNASNDPLIVIDGVPVESNGISGSGNLLNTINPNDIESMSVLKDASATALYGSRATNGVIIITTKKGTSSKLQFNFNTKFSVSHVPDYVDVLSGDQVRDIVNNNGRANYIALLGNANTNWQKQIYQTAFGYDNNFSVGGKANLGSFQLPFRISAGYLSQEGVLKTNKFNRTSIGLNLSPKFFDDHLSVNINTKFATTPTRFADEGAIGSAVGYDPTQNITTTSSNYGGYFEWEQSPGSLNTLGPYNPVAMLMLRKGKSIVDRFIGNVQLDYKMHFFPDLHLLVNVGTDYADGGGGTYINPTSANSVRNFSSKGNYSFYGQIKNSRLADVQLFYQKDLGKGTNIDVLAGHGWQDFYTTTFAYSELYATDGVVRPGTTPVDPMVKAGFAIESYIGRVNLTLADKYLLTGSIRRDASSKFAEQNRVGYFPAAAFAWKLKDEFFKNSSTVSDLKLRLGWGITGQQDGINWNYYSPVYYQSSPTARYQFGDVFYYPYRPSAYNSELKWETTTTYNGGLDYGFLDNRITGAIDVYFKKTKDLLSYVDIAPGANFDITQLRNIGSLENKGIEFSINTIPVRTDDFMWELGGNFTYNTSEITSLYNQGANPNFKGIEVGRISGGTGNNIGVHAVGETPFTFLPLKQVYDANGKPIEGLYEDINRDGEITDADRYYYNHASPNYLFGFSTGITYKKFTAGLTGHGMLGNYLYNNYNSNNAVLRNIENPVLHIGNAGVNYLETLFQNNRFMSDYYIENASFFRLDNFNLGYNVGKISKGVSMRVNASVQNIAVFTKYTGYDPENASSDGIDNNIYPRPRIYSVGANLDF
ncbi:MAG: SusC/RagA family TonB-linked outer membrane protein [Niabella sp.]